DAQAHGDEARFPQREALDVRREGDEAALHVNHLLRLRTPAKARHELGYLHRRPPLQEESADSGGDTRAPAERDRLGRVEEQGVTHALGKERTEARGDRLTCALSFGLELRKRNRKAAHRELHEGREGTVRILDLNRRHHPAFVPRLEEVTPWPKALDDVAEAPRRLGRRAPEGIEREVVESHRTGPERRVEALREGFGRVARAEPLPCLGFELTHALPADPQ